MKEDTARDRKSSKAAMHFSLAQNNIKCLHSCSKVWFGLSTEVCAAISSPAFFCRRFHVSQFQSTRRGDARRQAVPYARKAATGNARSPMVEWHVGGTTSVDVDADLRRTSIRKTIQLKLSSACFCWPRNVVKHDNGYENDYPFARLRLSLVFHV